MVKFMKRFLLTIFFIIVIGSNMVLMNAPEPWLWIPIGIDITLVVLAIVTSIWCIFKVGADSESPYTDYNQPNFGPKPKDKKKKKTKKKSNK